MHPNGIRFGAKIEIKITKFTFQFSGKTKHRIYSFHFQGKRKCQNQSFPIQFSRKSKMKSVQLNIYSSRKTKLKFEYRIFLCRIEGTTKIYDFGTHGQFLHISWSIFATNHVVLAAWAPTLSPPPSPPPKKNTCKSQSTVPKKMANGTFTHNS